MIGQGIYDGSGGGVQQFPDLLDVDAVMGGHEAHHFLQGGRAKDGMACFPLPFNRRQALQCLKGG